MRFRRPIVLIFSAALGILVMVCWVLAVHSGKSFEAIIESPDEIALYEGLPHQNYESRLFELERQTKAVRQYDKYLFYEAPITLKPDDRQELNELILNPESLLPWKGEKKCGGFHPDYALEFRKGWSRYQVLICFGCHEAKVVGPRRKSRHDLGRQAYNRLAEVLKTYRTNRPPRKLDEDV